MLPPANPRSKPEPAILEFNGIPRANSQRRRSIRLVYYDVAGEVFNDDRLTLEYAPYVRTGEIRKDAWPVGKQALAALWERAGTVLARALVGEAKLSLEFLRQLASPRAFADALLDEVAPSELCGTNASAEYLNDCLSALRSAATGKVWRAWVKRWDSDPALSSFRQNERPWWRRWKRNDA